MIITISGDAGSGKSSTADVVAKILGYKRYSTGNLMREIAKERGVDIVQLAHIVTNERDLDIAIDDKTIELGKNEDNFVIDSWLAAKFIPHAFRVFLTADIDQRVKRRLLQKRDTESFDDPLVAKKAMIDRENANRNRWISLYDFDYKNKNNYDLVIDTTHLTLEKTAEIIIDASKKKNKYN